MTCKQIITRMLLRKPSGMRAEHFNNRIKDYSWQEINESLAILLKEEIIAVTDKRFWIRDNTKAMNFINGRRAS